MNCVYYPQTTHVFDFGCLANIYNYNSLHQETATAAHGCTQYSSLNKLEHSSDHRYIHTTKGHKLSKAYDIVI